MRLFLASPEGVPMNDPTDLDGPTFDPTSTGAGKSASAAIAALVLASLALILIATSGLEIAGAQATQEAQQYREEWLPGRRIAGQPRSHR